MRWAFFETRITTICAVQAFGGPGVRQQWQRWSSLIKECRALAAASGAPAETLQCNGELVPSHAAVNNSVPFSGHSTAAAAAAGKGGGSRHGLMRPGGLLACLPLRRRGPEQAAE